MPTTTCRRTGSGGPGASRQIQARSEIPACARISRIPGWLPVASTAWRPRAGMPRPAWTSTGSRRSSASANTGARFGWSSANCSARGWSLMPRAPRSSARSASASGVAVRVEPAEGEQAAVRGRGLLDHHVVRRRVSVGLVHREDERASVDALERADELLAGAPVAVGVVRPDVSVRVERLEVADLLLEQLEPRHHAAVVDHAAETTKSRGGNARARRFRGRA